MIILSNEGENTMMNLKRMIGVVLALVLLAGCAAVYAETAETKETEWTSKITAHFATPEEGQELIRIQKSVRLDPGGYLRYLVCIFLVEERQPGE